MHLSTYCGIQKKKKKLVWNEADHLMLLKNIKKVSANIATTIEVQWELKSMILGIKMRDNMK